MRVAQALKRNVRRSLSLARWAFGRRVYPWTESPPHRLLGFLGQVAYRGHSPAHRLAYIVLAALLKHREQVYADKMNFVATARGRVSPEVLRNFVVWQRKILQNQEVPPGFRIHGSLCVTGGQDDVQVDRLFSVFCLSEVFNNLSIFWGEETMVQSLPLLLTRAERGRAAAQDIRFDLDAASDADVRVVELEVMPRAFSPLFEPRRTLTTYLKVAHLRAFVVALSLAEDGDGFCDAELRQWLPHLGAFRREFPGVAFCLLNRTMLGQNNAEPPVRDVAPVRGLGFGLQDAVATAQGADAFLGRLDVFGLAAISVRRPGVYFDSSNGDRHDPERLVWMFVHPTPQQCLAALRVLIRQCRPDWNGRERVAGRTEAKDDGTA